MTDQDEPEETIIDHIGYTELTQQAFRDLMRKVLDKISREGVPAPHAIEIGFLTQAPGVDIHETLVTRFPNDMVIVFQHQFSNLEVRENSFAVTLYFGGVPRRLTVPWGAVFLFSDKSVNFHLQFDITAYEDEAYEENSDVSQSFEENSEQEAEKVAPKIIRLDQFRNK